MSSVICKKCTRSIRSNTKGVNCSNCNSLFHLSCGKISEALVKEIEEGTTDWRCPSCRDNKSRKSLVVSSGAPIERSLSTSSLDASNSTDITNTINKLAASLKKLNEYQQSCAATFDTISQQMQELQNLSVKVNEHDARIQHIEKDNKIMKSTIKMLTKRLDNVDQRYSNDKLQFSQVPFTEGENIRNIVVGIGRQINIQLNNDDILDAYRTKPTVKNAVLEPNFEGPRSASSTDFDVQPVNHGKATSNNTIVVKFRSRLLRNNIINSFRNEFKKEGLFLDNNKKNRIFINEHLSSNRRRLLFKTKLFAKANNYKYVWTRNGTIFLRKGDGTKKISVDCLTDFASIEENGAAGRVDSQ